MAVILDNLQIQIQSSSAVAAQGIDNLATSLEKLKKNGSFKTVSTNLNRLSDSLNGLPNVYQASNSLRTLANSIEKLKGVGTVSTLANSIEKLPKALKSMSSINIEKIEPRIKGIANAVIPLTQIKSSGFSSMINSMAKLKKVTDSLDDTTIGKFAAKIKQLNDVVGPFATKMGTIKSALSGINTAIKQTNASVSRTNEEVDVGTLNFSNFANSISAVATAIQAVVQKFSEFLLMAAEWDGISARFGRGFGAQAQDTYEWVQRLNKEMGINVQQFMQYSSVYATMLTGFGVASKDASKMALGYAELTYDIWAGYNDIYKTFDEAAEAVRSAIAGEVEPVRRAGFTIIESTLEQTAANHGLEISLANATEAQKSYLRYLTLVDQAHSQSLVGTYAKEMNTAEGLTRTLTQQIKSLAQAFGSLFLPILVKVLPWVQAFVELLTEGVHWLAGLLGVEIQKVDFSGYESGAGAIENVTNSAGNAADALGSATKAAKELKNATLGIDELNVISPSSALGDSGGGSGSGSGSGGAGFADLGIDSLWDETIFDTIQSDVDTIKEKLRGWMPVIAGVAAALAGLRLVKLLNDIKAIQAITVAGGLLKKFSGFATAFASLAKEGGFIAALAAAFPKIATAMSTFVGNFGAFIALAKEGGVMQALAAAFPKVANALSSISSKFGPIGWIIAAVIAAIAFLIKNWEKMKNVVKKFFDEDIAPKFAEIKKHIDKLKETLEPLAPVFEWLGKAFKWLGDVFMWVIEAIGGIVVALTAGGLAGAFRSIVSVIEGFVQWFSGAVQVIRGIVELIIGIFTGDGEKIVEACKKIGAGIKDVFVGLYDMTIGAVVEFVKGVISWFVKMWDELVGHSIVPDTINAIVDWFASLPSKVFGLVQKFVSGIIDKFKNLGSSLSEKFSSAWNTVKTWWSKKSDLKSYVPSIGSIYDKLKERWDSARTWWNDKKSKLKEYTPSIGSIYEKVYDRWKNARDWWNSKKGSFKSYTPSIGSIVDKVKSAWNSAKSWWSKNVGGLSTKLNISVPKLTVNWGEVSALGKTFKYPKSFSVKFAADGGIFDQGSLIWAGERGPEVMATAAGGKTGVMNVQQMQDAVYEGVYAAMSAAMRGSNEGGGSPVIRVYLDGKQVTASVEQHQRERGASIMGNEVYSY